MRPSTFRLLSIVAPLCTLSFGQSSPRPEQAIPQYALQTRVESAQAHQPEGQDLELLDTVLLATVDGMFHAVNRSSGRTLWTMDQPLHHFPDANTNLYHLIRTEHIDAPPDLTDDIDDLPNFEDPPELYIIEPQSGDIFVNPPHAGREDPLQKLPYSISQLVDLSPFTFEDHERTFVGRKRTAMITLDLDTGELLEVIDSEQCSWSHPNRHRKSLSRDFEDILDELENDTFPPRPRREVHIGRTDYHVSVVAQGRTVQNLTYSSYGPNNVDREIQSHWRRTPDQRYFQPTPNGHLWAFKADERPPAQWSIDFHRPIVAIFDSVMLPGKTTPRLLLQPVPSLTDLLPHEHRAQLEGLQQQEVTYVGRVGNSLYAMSHTHFPLVALETIPKSKPRTIGTGESEGSSVDSVDYPYDDGRLTCRTLDCLTGTHFSESAASSRLSRLIAPVDEPSSAMEKLNPLSSKMTYESTSIVVPPNKATVIPEAPIPTQSRPQIGTEGSKAFADLASPLFTAISLVGVLIWMLASKFGFHFNPRSRRVKYVEGSRVSQPPPPALPADPIPNSEAIVIPPIVLPSPEASISDAPSIPEPIAQPAPEVSTPKKQSAALPPPGTPANDAEDGDDGELDEEGGNDKLSEPRKKGRVRRKRGKGGKKAGGKDDNDTDVPADGGAFSDNNQVVATPSKVITKPVNTSAFASSLVVSDQILGYGSHGTVVYEGAFQGRAVAVKRLLQDFVTLASREVSLLQESDDHPNVIRYYFKEQKDNFLYIALELCPASLAELVERPDNYQEISAVFDPKKALSQVTAGLRHLHSLKIIHRDIKPQNILISKPVQSKRGGPPQYRMLISDFGLCKKLDTDQTSFAPTAFGAMAAGTIGWRAPEILRREVNLDEQYIDSPTATPNSSLGGMSSKGSSSGQSTRLTKSVDIFALGCLYYYTLSSGDHPYGSRFEREVNILKDEKSLDFLDRLGEEGTEARRLIESMLDQDPKLRPDTTSCLTHPFFWNSEKRLAFLLDVSDKFEKMERNPPEEPLVQLETNANQVVGNDWYRQMDKSFIDNLGKYRKYDGKSIQDLLRAFRNKRHHYQDMPDSVKRMVGPVPHGFLGYFTKRFPKLFMHVYDVVASDPMLTSDALFRGYFDYNE